MSIGRLAVEAPDLYQLLKSANPSEWRTLVRRACEMGVESSGLTGVAVVDASAAVARGSEDRELASIVQTLADALDARYFKAQEAEREDWLSLFRQARAAAALSFALLASSVEEAADAIYEAAHATDSPPAVYRRLVAEG